jgi:hypothetical protein
MRFTPPRAKRLVAGFCKVEIGRKNNASEIQIAMRSELESNTYNDALDIIAKNLAVALAPPLPARAELWKKNEY